MKIQLPVFKSLVSSHIGALPLTSVQHSEVETLNPTAAVLLMSRRRRASWEGPVALCQSTSGCTETFCSATLTPAVLFCLFFLKSLRQPSFRIKLVLIDLMLTHQFIISQLNTAFSWQLINLWFFQKAGESHALVKLFGKQICFFFSTLAWI